MNWTQQEAIALCFEIEQVCPKARCHVALTGGCLYKAGERKDLDILFYRIRQALDIDMEELWNLLKSIGIERLSGEGWCHKGSFQGKPIDFFFPEEDYGVYEEEEITLNP